MMPGITIRQADMRPPVVVYDDDAGQRYRTNWPDTDAMNAWMDTPAPGESEHERLLRAALILHRAGDPTFSRLSQRESRRYSESRSGQFDA